MTLPPARALLSLWNDIAPHRIDEYDRWHTLEHVPERVWVPGFISGTRYVAETPSQVRYFTLYEMDDLACLRSAAYQDLVNHPTPWSASMRPSFSNFLRKTGTVAAGAGVSLGSAVHLVRWVWPEASAPDAAALQALAGRLLQDGAALGVTRVRIQQVETAGPQAMSNVDRAPAGCECIGIVETLAADRLEALARLVEQSDSAPGFARPAWREAGSYRLASRVQHADVAAPLRPAPRLDLMPDAA